MLLWGFYNLVLTLTLFLRLCLKNWLVIWVLIELVTVLVIRLIGTSISPRVVEGMSKYYIMQAVARAILLLGILWQYFEKKDLSIFSNYIGFSYGFILVGLFIKLAAFPSPFWFIDVMRGVGLLRGFYVIIVSKMIPIYLYITIRGTSNNFLLAVGLGTVAIGSLCGIKQTKVRKLIGFSSIAHLGWLLLGFPLLSSRYCLFIFLCYIIMVFPIIWLCSYYEVEDFSKVKRCYFQPWVLFILVVTLLSLGGFPPLLGFVYKWTIFQGLLRGRSLLLCGYLILMSLISLFFYLRLCYLLYRVYWPEPKIVLLRGFLGNSIIKTMIWFFVIFQTIILLIRIFCIGHIKDL
jgi:NADH:ubiquinone oxidoreductase subunit 2 (subunit N)